MRRILTSCDGSEDDFQAVASLATRHAGEKATLLVVITDPRLRTTLAERVAASRLSFVVLPRERIDLPTVMAAAVATGASDIVMRPSYARGRRLDLRTAATAIASLTHLPLYLLIRRGRHG